MPALEDVLRQIIREEIREALQELPQTGTTVPVAEPEEESWRSKLWRVEPETRLDLEECAEALGVSPRTVRRYIDGSGGRPALPALRSPSGLSVTASALRTWIRDCEEAAQFREEGGRGR